MNTIFYRTAYLDSFTGRKLKLRKPNSFFSPLNHETRSHSLIISDSLAIQFIFENSVRDFFRVLTLQRIWKWLQILFGMVLMWNTFKFTNNFRQSVYENFLFVSRLHRDLKVAENDLEHGSTEFLERIAVVTFAHIKLIVADRMQDSDTCVFNFSIRSCRLTSSCKHSASSFWFWLLDTTLLICQLRPLFPYQSFSFSP